jgi:DNA mismatch repair protein MutS
MVPGPADRSYGIEVAKLAGVPRGVVQRAKEILGDLEQKSTHLRGEKKKSPGTVQSLLPGLKTKKSEPKAVEQDKKTHPLLDELQKIDTEGLTPLDALNLLDKWKKKWVENDKNN